MVLTNIEKLIEKYNNAETTLEEEAQLKAYFAGDDVAPHLEQYKPLFQYFSQAKQEYFTKEVPLQSDGLWTKKRLFQWVSVAAIAVIMLGFLFPIVNNEPRTLADYTLEEQQMYMEAKHALAMLSHNFNDGASSFNALNLASENFNVGLEKANHVKELSKTTDKLLKN